MRAFKKIIFSTLKYQIYVPFQHAKTRFTAFVWSLRLKSVGHEVMIEPGCIFADANQVEIGHHVYIGHGSHFYTAGAYISIGNYVLIGPNTSFLAANRDTSRWEMPIYFGTSYKSAPIIIEDDVWIGKNAVITAGVTLHRGSVVGAGAIVTKDVPAYAIVGGNPAKIIKSRFDTETIQKAHQLDLSQFSHLKKDRRAVKKHQK